MAIPATLQLSTILSGWPLGLLCIVLCIGTFLVLGWPFQSSAEIPIVNGKQRWELFSTNAKRRFRFNAEELIRLGFSEKSSPFMLETDLGPRLVLQQRYLDEIERDHRFTMYEAAEADHLLDLPGLETMFHGTLHTQMVGPAVVAMSKRLVQLTNPLSEEAVVGLKEQWTESSDWHEISLQPTMAAIVARLSSLAFLGNELCRDPTWLEIAVNFTITRVIAVQDVQMWPRVLQPLVHWFLPSCWKLRAQVRQARQVINPALELEKLRLASHDSSPFRILGWSHQFARGRRYDPTIAQLRLTFVAIHTTADMMMKVILNICQHAHLIEEMRREVISVVGKHGLNHSSLQRLHLMDSVMKEVQRLEPASIVTMARCTVDRVVLSDGTTIPKGTQIIFPNVHMRESSASTSSAQFDGYRFLRMREDTNMAKFAAFTSPSSSHMGFGYGKHACPGRYFAADEIKILLCHILLMYDVRLVDTHIPEVYRYGFTLPRDPKARILVRRRPEEINI
ncbi:cytochrome P450 [Aspergillus californicus]